MCYVPTVALLKKQADLVNGGFYILEEPNKLLKRYIVGPLAGVGALKSSYFGQFNGFNLSLNQAFLKQSFIFTKEELKAFLMTGLESRKTLSLSLTEEEKKNYFKIFFNIKEEMKKADLFKAVLYIKVEQSLKGFVSLNEFSFQALMGLKNKKSGYLFGFYNPLKKKALLGCSPEFLFKTTAQGNCITTAIAGTLKTADVLKWDKKLTTEHQMVMDGISKDLEFKVQWGPVKSFEYGKLSHLIAEGVVDKAVDIKKLSGLLHPTPAVGTFPRQYCRDLKLGPEGRGYFGGYVEGFGFQRPFSLVSIRCFEWINSKVQVCIGGGVLKESLVDQEWAELENKWITFKSIWEI